VADYFFDSSALAKAYVAETGTHWVRTLLDDEQHRIYISQLAEVEVIAALTRRFSIGDLTQQDRDQLARDARQDCASFLVVNITAEIIEAAVDLALKYNLRAYDAVQLASALEVRDLLVQNSQNPSILSLVSADLELNRASALEGVQVDNPNFH
jgi:predicted nucleic acid-binding protein